MSDYLTRSFRAQVTTAMDSVLRATVFEITKIFESSLHGYQVELIQRGEEIIRLQKKLQQSESKLKEMEDGGDRSTEKKKLQSEDAPTASTASQQISDDPEIDVEEPDDWCAPLGCESLTTQDSGVCPSVRLRPLSISLWHVPIKQEVQSDDSESRQPTKEGRKSKKNKRNKYIQDRSLTLSASRNRSTETERLLKAVKEEIFDLPRFNSSAAFKEHLRIHAHSFACTKCPKKFRTKQALELHKTRIHKRKNYTEFNGDLSWTRPLEEFEDQQVNPGFPNKDPSHTVTHGNDQLSSRDDIKQSKEPEIMGSRHSDGFACSVCNKVCKTKYTLTVHFRVHAGQKPFESGKYCKKFNSRSNLHKDNTTDSCPASNLVRCEKCAKKFYSQKKYKKHMIEFHSSWPYSCKICGKGFCTKGRYRNHYERVHVNATVEVTV
ncbi:hypothetical protein LDENG_00053350 [Lucifuga dentata]|nr:hypothetical protein LDENG_00053350 [Lucifuga dentata]